jgi:outer membrane protein OmpA-like peptidoglycan-associated protein/tetratricopeptide (TPR) repeat protein
MPLIVNKIFRYLLVLLFFFGLNQAMNPILAQGPRVVSTTDKKLIKSFEKAYDAYQGRNVEEAIKIMEKAVDKNPEFQEGNALLFDLYLEMGDRNKAIFYGDQLLSVNPNFSSGHHFFMAGIKRELGRYEEALKHLEKFFSMPYRSKQFEEVALRDIESCRFAIEALKNPKDFNPINLGEGVNSKFPEYFPCLTGDDQIMFFTRLIPNKNAFNGVHEDFFISVKDEQGNWGSAQNFKQINSIMNEGAGTISADGSLFIFTACEIFDDYGQNRTGFGSCDLFFSRRVGDSWTEPKNMGRPVNSKAWESQPSLSADGRTLYFVRGISKGRRVDNQDIFVTYQTEQDKWTTPIRLPDNINTPFSEESVMIHPDGKTLYFSSDGHPGMGGLDIFVTRKQPDGSWSNPENLGYPINSGADENSLLVDSQGALAYFASDREGGFGDLDLYAFELPEELKPIPTTYAKGIVYDNDNRKPLGARLELENLTTGEKTNDLFSDASNGNFLMMLPLGNDYALSVSKPGYLFYSQNFTLKGEGLSASNPYIIEVPLLPIKAGGVVVLNNIFFDFDRFELKAESRIELEKLTEFLTQNPSLKIEISGHTDNQGNANYNKNLSNNRAKSVVDFLVDKGIEKDRLSFKGYGAEQPLADNSTEEGRAKNRRTEFKVIDL